MTKDVRELLEEHGLELTIERIGDSSRWVLRKKDNQISIAESKLTKLCEAFDEIERICQEVKLLLC